MIRRYHYTAETESGETFETVIHSNVEDTANVEAKIEVERWLRSIGESARRLIAFDLAFVEPQP